MKIIVTGFDPFDGEKTNPSWEAVKQLPDEIDGAHIFKVELPTVFYESMQVMHSAVSAIQPDYIIHVGQAGGRKNLSFEKVAINLNEARIPDNKGQQPVDEPIHPDGDTAYFSTLPLKAAVQTLKEHDIPAEISYTAGTFVCNHIFYDSCYQSDRANSHVKVEFIHVPFIPEQVTKDEYPSLPLATIIEGLHLALKTFIKYYDREDLKLPAGTTH